MPASLCLRCPLTAIPTGIRVKDHLSQSSVSSGEGLKASLDSVLLRRAWIRLGLWVKARDSEAPGLLGGLADLEAKCRGAGVGEWGGWTQKEKRCRQCPRRWLNSSALGASSLSHQGPALGRPSVRHLPPPTCQLGYTVSTHFNSGSTVLCEVGSEGSWAEPESRSHSSPIRSASKLAFTTIPPQPPGHCLSSLSPPVPQTLVSLLEVLPSQF